MPQKKRLKVSIIKRNGNKKKRIREICSGEKSFLFLIAVCFVFILDRYTKILSAWISGCFVFCIGRSFNYGAAFNLLAGFGWTRAFLIIVAIAVLFFTAFFYFQTKKFNYFHVGLILLFAGTLGNLFDRVYYGYVIDWLSFGPLRTSPFNIADISNLVGVLLLIISLLRKK
ncbi:MAG: signal peptidase II [Candidatus Pacearchaeota archaeon]|nr:signal peptidase II [Candidatus Pacearchaeota archaeon]